MMRAATGSGSVPDQTDSEPIRDLREYGLPPIPRRINVKCGMLCLLLLAGCGDSYEPYIEDYELVWKCRTPEGCERTEEVERIDRMKLVNNDAFFTSTQDESFAAEAKRIYTTQLPGACSWLYFLSLFGHELERSMICFGAATFELELSIPNEDPSSSSTWLVEGRYVGL
jgi:hypothetical protein